MLLSARCTPSRPSYSFGSRCWLVTVSQYLLSISITIASVLCVRVFKKKRVKLTVTQIQNLMAGTGQQGRWVGHRDGTFFVWTPTFITSQLHVVSISFLLCGHIPPTGIMLVALPLISHSQ